MFHKNQLVVITLWLKFHDNEFNLKNLQLDIKHKEHRILIN